MHTPFRPAHTLNLRGRHENVSTRPPIPRVDDEVADFPAVTSNRKFSTRPIFVVGVRNAIPHDFPPTAQMDLVVFHFHWRGRAFALARNLRASKARQRQRPEAPKACRIVSSPIRRITVIAVVLGFQAPRVRSIRLDRRAVLDLRARQLRVDRFRYGLLHAARLERYDR